MKIIKSFSIVAAFTLLSNILGYFREAALAAQYGASAATDAYFAAFFIPNTLYLILLSGSISTIFIPVFIEYRNKDKDEAWHIASSLFNISALVLSGIILICLISVRYWMVLLFPGFDEATMEMAITLVVILLPMLLFVGLSSLISSVLNSFEHFAIPALAPVVSNIFTIGVILYSDQLNGITTVALGVTIGMFIQFLLQVPTLFRKGAKYHMVCHLRHPALKRIGRLSLPLIIYLLFAYASLIIERNIASTLPEGTISSLNYALRVFSIPIAFTAGAIGTVIYPRLSLDIASHESDMFSRNVFRSMTGSLFFLAPISLWFIANSELVINMLFGYGKFTTDDVLVTSAILIGYSTGMAATGITRILQRSSYALQDTISPLWAEIGALILYVVIAPILTSQWGAWGLGIARGISFIFVMLALLWLLLRKRVEFLFSLKDVLWVIGKYFLAGALAVAVFGLAWENLLTSFNSRLDGFLKIGIFSGLGAVVYLLVGYSFRFGEVLFIHQKLLSLTDRAARS